MSIKNLKSSLPTWIYPKQDPEWLKAIIEEFNIHPVIAQVLISRNFKSLKEIHDFLYAKLPDLYDPDLFLDMDKAVDRILIALEKKEKILIYGDNDVDGITAAVLLTEFFALIEGIAAPYIPNRNSLKNSLMLDALEYAEKSKCALLITVDCGITSATEIESAVLKKIDVIVTDHHEPTAKLPHCVATLNPKLLNSTYPNRDLTGVGVAFKLAHAVTNKLIEQGKIPIGKIELKQCLDLVALGTIADMGALNGENRILVRYGLGQMRKKKRVGLAKLCSVSDVELGEISTIDIASKVAPRFNSLGRIADPNKGVKLLLLRDPMAAENLAKELDLNNLERQKIERKNSQNIEDYIFKNQNILKEKALVLSSSEWHPGIIPIITARIAKQYNRPTLVIAIEKGIGKGSIRTIPSFPLLPVLKANADLLINFGGHDYAAGLTITEENIPLFKEKFIQQANEQLKEQDIQTKIYLDAKIDFADLTFDFMEAFQLLEPFGNENPAPIFYCEVQQMWPPKIIGKSHLKLYLDQKDRFLEGIAFGMAHRRASLMKKEIRLNIAFTPYVNAKSGIQLQIKDFQIKR